MKVAFQGERGAYSESALLNFFGTQAHATGFPLSEQVIEAVLDHKVDAAILPVENSIVGNVAVNLDLIYHHEVEIWGEYYQPIKHCLMALPGVRLEDLQEVSSHPIALSQCHHFLAKHKIRPHAEYDTAGAAKVLQQKALEPKSKVQGIIASKLCAEYYGLEILSDQIQNVPNNFTRFVVLSRLGSKSERATPNKTSMAFATAHRPGALLECLHCFSRHKLNLTKIESRPDPDNPFQYIFFVDFMTALNDGAVEQCLNELKQHTLSIKILGNYLAASFGHG